MIKAASFRRPFLWFTNPMFVNKINTYHEENLHAHRSPFASVIHCSI